MRKLRVNIFDDDVTVAKMLKQIIMLERDYEILTFEIPVVCPIYSTQTDECKNLKPCADIVITDYQMPNMTGVELLRLQMQRGCKIDTRNKALMSANSDSIKQKMLEELGFAFFSKPLDINEVFAWLDDCEKRIDLAKPVGIIRATNRYPADIDVLYAYNKAEKIHKGISMNYSGGGFCLKANAPLMVGQSIVIINELPNGCKNASVCWVKPMEPGFYIAGLMAQ